MREALGAGSPGRRNGGRRGAALAASVLLHLAIAILVAWITRGRPSSPPAQAWLAPPGPPPVEITLVERRAPAPTEPAPGGPQVTRPAPRRLASAPAPARPVRAPPSSRASPPTGPAVPVAPSPTPATPAPPVNLSFAALAETAKQRVAAGPSADEDLERLLAGARDPDRGGPRRSAAQLYPEAERRADAVQNVRAGRTHPLYFDYLRGARAVLAPAATRLAEALPLGAGATTKGWVGGYLGRVDQVNRGIARDVPGERKEDVGGPRPDVLGAYAEMERQAATGAVQRTARVCLGIAPKHTVVATLRRSSGNAALDQLALDAFQGAAGARPVDADVRPGLACYLVRISAYRVPPTPSVSLIWKKKYPELVYPFKRMTEVKVELESVDYGPPAGPPALVHVR